MWFGEFTSAVQLDLHRLSIILHCQRNGKIDRETGGVLGHDLCHLSKITKRGGYTDVASVNC